MNTGVKLALSVLVVVVTLAGAGLAGAQPAAGNAGIVGAWMLVSETGHLGDNTSEPFGPHPVGSIIFDRSGRFMLLISRPDLPKFAANSRDAGTPEENKAVLAGFLAYMGTYSFNEADQVLTLHVEASSFPNWTGTDQKRSLKLDGDKLLWINRTPAIRGPEFVDLVWRRAPLAAP